MKRLLPIFALLIIASACDVYVAEPAYDSVTELSVNMMWKNTVRHTMI